jgi:VanZ family protein
MRSATPSEGRRFSAPWNRRPEAEALVPSWGRRILGVLCVGMALGFLLLGWWPFSPSPPNRVRWVVPGPGLAFEAPGVAYSPGALASHQAALPESFSVELYLSPRGGPRAASQYILSLHDGAVPSAFAVCQWKAELLLRIPELTNVRGFREVAVGGLDGSARLFTIVCRSSGTEVFVDGRLSRRFPQFRVPAAVWRGRLVLGDAASGKQAWTGELRGLALIEQAMDSDLIAHRFEAWRSGNKVELQRGGGVAALFLFDEQTATRVASVTPLGTHLEIPARYEVVQKQAFSFPLNRWEFWRSGRRDAVVNLLGFVPFGGLLFLWVESWAICGARRAGLIATLGGLALSAAIETGQIWLPTRVSSATDLILNTLGSLLGAWLTGWLVGILVRLRRCCVIAET